MLDAAMDSKDCIVFRISITYKGTYIYPVFVFVQR